MGKWGSCDFKQLKRFQEKMQKLDVNQINEICISLTNELSARLLRKVIKRTPVGQYPSGSGKTGGTLRRGWNIGEITKSGNTYEVEIINPTEYASYVEFGHRTRNHKDWVKGRFMITISEKELEAQATKVIEKRIMEYLEWCFNG
jgi:hypothetical protein